MLSNFCWTDTTLKSPRVMKREVQEVVVQSTASAPRLRYGRFVPLIAFAFLAVPSSAHASFLESDTLDSVCEFIAWLVLVIVPIAGITIFWLVHILPEQIAEKKRHPQVGAIKCVVLLSLVFGGMLWPFAWLWAYTKPVLHKMAYGTDVGEGHGDEKGAPQTDDEELELQQLRRRVAELETKRRAESAVVHRETR
jgi:hypothetical protein